MGFYIEVPNKKGKAQQLADLYGAEILSTCPEEYWMHDSRQALICVVDNGPFEAAGLCYDDQEFQDFKHPDDRPKTWLLMDRAKAWELSGFTEDYI